MKEWEEDIQVLNMSHFYLGEYVCKVRTHGTRLGQGLLSFYFYLYSFLAFYVLCIGIGISSFVFFCEIIILKCERYDKE